MRPHPQIRKMVKWGGVVLAAAATWQLFQSARHARFLTWSRPGEASFLWSSQGALSYTTVPQPGPVVTGAAGSRWAPDGWGWGSYPIKTPSTVWRPVYRIAPGDTCIQLPLWILTSVGMLASATAWRLDTLARRRAKIGACPGCSYDRTGLAATAPCPECGKAA